MVKAFIFAVCLALFWSAGKFIFINFEFLTSTIALRGRIRLAVPIKKYLGHKKYNLIININVSDKTRLLQ
jgi:hypothetical protein